MQVSSRTVAWTIGILAVVLVVIPLLGMLGMMAVGGTMMDGMMGMHTAGFVWLLLAAVVVIGLVVVLFRQTTKT
jgi:hypothetical protein